MHSRLNDLKHKSEEIEKCYENQLRREEIINDKNTNVLAILTLFTLMGSNNKALSIIRIILIIISIYIGQIKSNMCHYSTLDYEGMKEEQDFSKEEQYYNWKINTYSDIIKDNEQTNKNKIELCRINWFIIMGAMATIIIEIII